MPGHPSNYATSEMQPISEPPSPVEALDLKALESADGRTELDSSSSPYELSNTPRPTRAVHSDGLPRNRGMSSIEIEDRNQAQMKGPNTREEHLEPGLLMPPSRSSSIYSAGTTASEAAFNTRACFVSQDGRTLMQWVCLDSGFKYNVIAEDLCKILGYKPGEIRNPIPIVCANMGPFQPIGEVEIPWETSKYEREVAKFYVASKYPVSVSFGSKLWRRHNELIHSSNEIPMLLNFHKKLSAKEAARQREQVSQQAQRVDSNAREREQRESEREQMALSQSRRQTNYIADQPSAGPSRQDDRQVESPDGDTAYRAYLAAQHRAAGLIPVLLVDRVELQAIRDDSFDRAGQAPTPRPQKFWIPQQGQSPTNNYQSYYQTPSAGSGLSQSHPRQQPWGPQQSQSPTSQQSNWYQVYPRDGGEKNRWNQE